MGQKILFFIIITFLNKADLAAQDSADIKNPLVLPTGIYYTSKSFFNKQPDFIRPFRVVTNYHHRFIGDSIPYGNTFWILDSTNISGYVFGFFDGKDMYMKAEKEGYFKIDRLGKYPYISLNRGSTSPIFLFFTFFCGGQYCFFIHNYTGCG